MPPIVASIEGLPQLNPTAAMIGDVRDLLEMTPERLDTLLQAPAHALCSLYRPAAPGRITDAIQLGRLDINFQKFIYVLNIAYIR